MTWNYFICSWNGQYSGIYGRTIYGNIYGIYGRIWWHGILCFRVITYYNLRTKLIYSWIAYITFKYVCSIVRCFQKIENVPSNLEPKDSFRYVTILDRACVLTFSIVEIEFIWWNFIISLYWSYLVSSIWTMVLETVEKTIFSRFSKNIFYFVTAFLSVLFPL